MNGWKVGIVVVASVLAFAFGSAQAEDQPIEDGSKVAITSPKDGEKVGDTFELKYELAKGSSAHHAHVYLDGQYQKGFNGTFKGVPKGKHEIKVTAATDKHKAVNASASVTVEVQ
ncbi:MAG: hypothetical protein HZB35_02515 [Nitrospirae bacterium]|nr:hypothetical protein [Nitrospirota bacterium]